MKRYQMYIGGEWVEAASGETYTAVNPATEEPIAEIPKGGKADADEAVRAAADAFQRWSEVPFTERCALVKKIAEGIRENAQELGRLDTLDHGTPARMAVMFTLGSAGHLDFAAEAARTLLSEHIPSRPNVLTYIRNEPVGVVAVITPWNAPLMMICDKLGALLATGNTCVIKPPSIDSMQALKLAEVVDGMGLPPGVVNIITGPGSVVGEALSSHPDVNMVAFTGSCEAGKQIMASAAGTVKRLGMELGGKNPFIVLADADLDAAVGKAVMTQYANSGMICAAPGRIYVHESLYDEFLSRFVELTKKSIVAGDPNDEKTTMGPLVSAEHRDRVEGFIKSGIDEGARLLLGGERPTKPPMDKGYYVVPTVFADVTPAMTIYKEEIFGPVACIGKFSDDEAVVVAANDNTFGLCASVWTTDGAKGIRYAARLRAGTVWVNDHLAASAELPWGGFKESGFGKVTGVMGIEEFTQQKVVWVDLYNGKQPFPPGPPPEH